MSINSKPFLFLHPSMYSILYISIPSNFRRKQTTLQPTFSQNEAHFRFRHFRPTPKRSHSQFLLGGSPDVVNGYLRGLQAIYI